MATEQDFRERVYHLLSSPAAGKIDLTLSGVHFNGAYFGLVGLAIFWKQLGFSGIGFRVGQVAATADAGYSPGDNVYDVPNWNYGTTAYQRQAIVHESIHAYLDIIKSRKTALTEEALAYIAGVLFHLHDTTPAGKTPTLPSWARPAIYQEVFRIASGLFTSGSTRVSADDANSMRDAIMADTSYESLSIDPTIRYANDGVW
jgi:hypothetical protein